MLNKETILQKLTECYDPEIPINVVDLGLIYNVLIEGDHIHVKMTLTNRGCPMASYLADSVTAKVKEIDQVNKVKVEIVWDPPWTPERISQEAKDTLNI